MQMRRFGERMIWEKRKRENKKDERGKVRIINYSTN